jgi:hypothetical protein
MARHATIPTGYCLNIYRLVVVGQHSQAYVARFFRVSRARVCKICRRVRAWVDRSVGDWLFPGRHDLRFYTALACEKISVQPDENSPESITLTGPTWEYKLKVRESDAPAASPTRSVSEGPASSTPLSTTIPLNNPAARSSAAPALTPAAATDSFDADIRHLAEPIAHLLTLWKKTRPVNEALKLTNKSFA